VGAAPPGDLKSEAAQPATGTGSETGAVLGTRCVGCPPPGFRRHVDTLYVDLAEVTYNSMVREGPVVIDALQAAARPLRYLDYLVEGPERAAVLGGDGVLVNVPDPARYALHKLIVAAVRPVSSAAKARKDLRQVELLLEVLLEDRPGALAIAWEVLASRGRRWLREARASLSRLPEALRGRLAQTDIA
jgi:hypothetical protein